MPGWHQFGSVLPEGLKTKSATVQTALVRSNARLAFCLYDFLFNFDFTRHHLFKN